jgi:hypothetical protein
VGANPYMQNRPLLEIKTSWMAVVTWNYSYDLNQWLELLPRD